MQKHIQNNKPPKACSKNKYCKAGIDECIPGFDSNLFNSS